MNDQQKTEQDSGVRDQEIRAALDQHWAASDANDFETEHLIYRRVPRSWNARSQASERAVDPTYQRPARRVQPSNKRFSIRNASLAAVIFGSPNSSLTYDSKPSYTVEHHGVQGQQGCAGDTNTLRIHSRLPHSRIIWSERMDT